MKKALFFIILVAAALIFLVMQRHHGEAGMLAETSGDAPPATELPLFDSLGSFKTADWKNKAYAVSFFGSWCPECRAEHDTLRSLAAVHVTIIGIAVNDNEVALKDFLARKGNPYEVVALDNGGRTSHAWGLSGVPETFIVDKAGIIRFHYLGPMSPSVAERDFLPVWGKVTQ